jgi:hypothetical protein
MLAAHLRDMNVAAAGPRESMKLSLAPKVDLQGLGVQFTLRF